MRNLACLVGMPWRTLALGLAVLWAFPFSQTAWAGRTEYRIGALFATSGGASMLGEPEKFSAEMVIDQINMERGVAGLIAFSPSDHDGLKIDGLAVLEVKEGNFVLAR